MIITLISLIFFLVIENILIIMYILKKRKDNKNFGKQMRRIYNPILTEMKRLDEYIHKMEYQ